jgi:palmitoyl-protein thioesterase
MGLPLRLLFLIHIYHYEADAYPTIVIHGIASSKKELEPFSNELYHELNSLDMRDMREDRENMGNMVYNMEIGNGELTSIFMDINEQCRIFSDNIKNLNIIEDKINIIGFSQGGLIARCYVEQYSHQIIGVHTLITIATPHMGIYNNYDIIPPVIKYYWKNPYEYLETNKFILFLNNEQVHDNSIDYKNNIKSLANFVVIWSKIDNIITPRESSKFEFYDINKAIHQKELEIQPLIKSPIYLNDTLGIKDLYSTNKLVFYSVDCNHEEFKLSKCFKNMGLLEILIRYLM